MKKKFVAIDGNSLLYRAFFAMRYLSTSGGQPTNALYGLTVMLLKVLEEKPDYIAVAFDTPKPTFRHEEYPEYKAHRKAAPDDLIAQMAFARDLIRAFGIPAIELEGYEADDIIGAMAKAAKTEGLTTMIVTGDLDELQVVDDDISVMTTVKGVSDTVVYDPEKVFERFHLRPDQMTDYKGLKGDPSDNIPGVPGIGEKTAADLLTRYGTLESLLDHLDELPEGKVRKALEQNIEIAKLSKRLATIVTDLPVTIDPKDYVARDPDYDALRDLFVRLEFKTMLKRLPEVGAAEGKAAPEDRTSLGTCRRIDTPAELEELIGSLEKAGEFAVQTRTLDGKSIQAQIVGLSFSVGPNDTAYVDVIDPARGGAPELAFDGPYQADLKRFESVLSSESVGKSCHDSKLNHAALALRGIALNGVAFDTMLAAYLLDSTRGSFEIGDVAFEQLSLELPGVTSKKSAAENDDPTLVCGEAEAIRRLRPVLEERLRKHGLWDLFAEVELPLAPILAGMELTGVAVDVKQLEALSVTLEVDIREIERKVYDQAGEEFNIGSPKQLQAVLFEKMGLATSRKTKTGYSTSASALEEMAVDYPIVGDILRYRELTKIKSTYADSLPRLINPKTGRVHTSLNQAVTSTGRLSSSDPNLQNIPIRTQLGREIRKAFIASGENLLLSADYSQIELRILAHITGDAGLVSAFENDEDIHRATACTLFGVAPGDVTSEMRRRAKTVNFAVIYGMADFTLSRSLGIPMKEAREYIETYFARFPGVRRFTDETIAKARDQGYVTTLLGRRRYIPDINSSNRNLRQFAERAAVNMPIQGTAADLIKLAMIRVDRSLKSAGFSPPNVSCFGCLQPKPPDTHTPGCFGCLQPKPAAPHTASMLLQVHDELLLEVIPSELSAVAGLVREGMERAYEMRVPLKVDVSSGKNWAEMSDLTS